jgi:hypothetical protein
MILFFTELMLMISPIIIKLYYHYKTLLPGFLADLIIFINEIK